MSNNLFHLIRNFLTLLLLSSRETGGLNRIIDRGSRAINFILSAMVFNVVPTILEVKAYHTAWCFILIIVLTNLILV